MPPLTRPRARPAKRRRTVQNTSDTAVVAAGQGANPGTTAAAAADSVDLAAFMNGLQREIGDLHKSIKASRDSRAEKAFQRLPRAMRRRTASHNAKRLPRRLRQQARRDQAADNTPSVAVGQAKRRKAWPASAWVHEKTKRRVREQQDKKMARQTGAQQAIGVDEDGMQVDELPPHQPTNPSVPFRLPTHAWMAKRAHMACPGALWHTVIPRTPNNKIYRASLRSAGLRPGSCLSWDTSFMANIGLRAATTDATPLLDALAAVVDRRLLTPAVVRGVHCLDAGLPRAFGYQTSASRLAGPGNCGVMTVVFQPTDGAPPEALLHVHPTIFSHVWAAVAAAVHDRYLAVALIDLRLQLGSIDLAGTSATDALLGLLRPYCPDDPQAADFLRLRALDPTTLAPASGAILAFDVHDPRYDVPEEDQELPVASTVDWPAHTSRRPSRLFDEATRSQATWLPSQQSLDQRRSKLPAGGRLLPTLSDHPIPILLAIPGAAIPLSAASSSGSTTTAGATPLNWTLLAPRGCIDILWRCLHRECLPSSGRRPLLAGLEEDRFVALERGRPWFPADFPGTPTGWDWELQSRRAAQAAWDKTPPAKRPQWSAVDWGRSGKTGKGELGSGFACDWEYLFGVDAVSTTTVDASTGTNDKDSFCEEFQFAALRQPSALVQGMHHVTWTELRAVAAARSLSPQPSAAVPWRTPYALATVALEMLGRGTPLARARIYRLPAADANAALRRQWLARAATDGRPSSQKVAPPQKAMRRMPPNADMATRKRLLAQSLLETQLPYPAPGSLDDQQQRLALPDADDLIGFVTSGAQRFQSGKGFGIGHVGAQKLIEAMAEAGSDKDQRIATRLCIVRNVGESVGWLARWTVLGC